MTNTKCQTQSTKCKVRNSETAQVITFPTTMPLTSSTHNPALLKVSGLEKGGSRNHHYHLHYAGDQDCNSVNLLERSGRRRHCFFGDWPCSQTQVSIVLMAMVISMAKRFKVNVFRDLEISVESRSLVAPRVEVPGDKMKTPKC